MQSVPNTTLKKVNVDTIVRGIEQPKQFQYQKVLKNKKRLIEVQDRVAAAAAVASMGIVDKDQSNNRNHQERQNH